MSLTGVFKGAHASLHHTNGDIEQADSYALTGKAGQALDANVGLNNTIEPAFDPGQP